MSSFDKYSRILTLFYLFSLVGVAFLNAVRLRTNSSLSLPLSLVHLCVIWEI